MQNENPPNFSNFRPTPKGSYSPNWELQAPSGNPLLRTPSENPSQNPLFTVNSIEKGPPPSREPSPRTRNPEPFSEPFLECCVSVRPLRHAPKCLPQGSLALHQRDLDDRQITHPIGVHLKDLLYDFLRGVLGPLI